MDNKIILKAGTKPMSQHHRRAGSRCPEMLAVRIRLGQNFRWSFCDAPLALGLCLTDCAQRAFCWHFKVASKDSKYFSKTLYPARTFVSMSLFNRMVSAIWSYGLNLLLLVLFKNTHGIIASTCFFSLDFKLAAHLLQRHSRNCGGTSCTQEDIVTR